MKPGTGEGEHPVVAYAAQPFPCPDCSFPLLGQPVEQWSDGLLVTRCPECGRVVGHPLGLVSRRDLRRQLSLRGAGWWLFIVALLLVPGAIMGAAASRLAWRLSAPFAEFITWSWFEEQGRTFEASGQQGHLPLRVDVGHVDDAWLTAQEPGALAGLYGGWSSLDWIVIASHTVWMLLLAGIAAGAVGLAMSGLGRRGMLAVGTVSALATGTWVFYRLNVTTSGSRFVQNAELAAYRDFGQPAATIVFAASVLLYSAALILMPPVARFLLDRLAGVPPRNPDMVLQMPKTRVAAGEPE